MCLRHIEYVAACQHYRSIALIDEQQARLSLSENCVLVVDVLCTTVHCFFRPEKAWEMTQRHRVGRSCGLGSCLTINRCCLIVLPPVDRNKRRRYVLDEMSVEGQTSGRQHHRHGVD